MLDLIARGDHLPAGDPAKGGIVFGSTTLTSTQVDEMRNGDYYVNIHTAANAGGEIRGQLVELITNQPPTVTCPDPVTMECTSPDGEELILTATVSDPDGDPLTVTWTVDGEDVQVNDVPSGGDTTEADVELLGTFDLGTTEVTVTVSDGEHDPVSCTTTVTIEDTTPPEIDGIRATPSTLWPANHKMVEVKVRVDATDICGETTARIVSVSSNEPGNDIGDGNTAPDWEITDDLELELRAERSGTGNGRVYTLTVEVSDESGNTASDTVKVRVPKSQGRSSSWRRNRSWWSR